MDINGAIRAFGGFLDSSWRAAAVLLPDRDYASDESVRNDWLQANWELLVERKVLPVNKYLEVYGDGADYNGASSRMTDPNALPDFRVIVRSKNSKTIVDWLNKEQIIMATANFEKLTGFENGFYVTAPPFNYVLVTDRASDMERVFALEDIRFELEKI